MVAKSADAASEPQHQYCLVIMFIAPSCTHVHVSFTADEPRWFGSIASALSNGKNTGRFFVLPWQSGKVCQEQLVDLVGLLH